MLIDRKNKIEALESIKIFAQTVRKNNWSVVIFAEGTRSRDGVPKPFQKGGLITLFKEIPEAQIIPVSIGNSWKLSRYNYFPFPLGIPMIFKFHPLQEINSKAPEETIKSLEEMIHQGVNSIQSVS